LKNLKKKIAKQKKRSAEENSKTPENKKKKKKDSFDSEALDILQRQEETKCGFQFGHEVEAILGAKMLPYKGKEQLMFYVQWKDKDVRTFIPNYEAKEREPKKVIEFYESRLKFEPPPE